MNTDVPVVVLGSGVNTYSVLRSLGGAGVTARIIAGSDVSMRSRYCAGGVVIPDGVGEADFYEEALLSQRRPDFAGSLIMSCSDGAVRFVATHHDQLAEHYLLERHDPALQLDLLNKERTLELAADAGVPTPEFRHVSDVGDLDEALESMPLPVMLKPHATHAMRRSHGSKYFLGHTVDEARDLGRRLLDDGVAFMLCDMIPGPDRASCSYYTYRDEGGAELLGLTKSCVRRFPVNKGRGTYQMTEHLPDIAELGRRFFDAVDYRGFGNLEFKRDARDGVPKVIECNNRFTAVQAQLVRAGADAALMTYADVVGEPLDKIEGCRPGVAMWSPRGDRRAFMQARASTGETWIDWAREIASHETVFPVFTLSDPIPALTLAGRGMVDLGRRALGRGR